MYVGLMQIYNFKRSIKFLRGTYLIGKQVNQNRYLLITLMLTKYLSNETLKNFELIKYFSIKFDVVDPSLFSLFSLTSKVFLT